MAPAIARSRAEEILEALATRDPDRIEPFLDDNIDWLLVGPVEIFPFCGQRIGKAAVRAAYEEIAGKLDTRSLVRDFLVVENDTAAALSRMTMVQKSSGRQANMRMSQFVRFREGKIVEFCAIFDSLGAIEQLLGRTLDLGMPAPV
jgi:ketosteroid isomerase-like protein